MGATSKKLAEMWKATTDDEKAPYQVLMPSITCSAGAVLARTTFMGQRSPTYLAFALLVSPKLCVQTWHDALAESKCSQRRATAVVD